MERNGLDTIKKMITKMPIAIFAYEQTTTPLSRRLLKQILLAIIVATSPDQGKAQTLTAQSLPPETRYRS